MERSIHPILIELQNHSKALFGFTLYSWKPISLGWLNLKWQLTTDQGDLLLKIYHSKRYSHLDVLNRALCQQQRLHNRGIPCPELLALDGEVLHTLWNEKFMIMRFCPGYIIKPSFINQQQMYDLGSVTGKMHRMLNDSSLEADETPQFVPQSRQERLHHWKNVIQEAKDKGKTHVIKNIELQMNLTESVDIESFGKSRSGWTHRDLWTDNVLFSGNKVSAVLDFDRLNYDYPELDVARAIMSWAYNHGELRADLAAAFLEGYRKEYEYPFGRLVHSLRMLWYLESVWWITASVDSHNDIPARFAEELIWLAQNDERFPAIVGQL
jgi:homoserine kinase type II